MNIYEAAQAAMGLGGMMYRQKVYPEFREKIIPTNTIHKSVIVGKCILTPKWSPSLADLIADDWTVAIHDATGQEARLMDKEG